MSIFCEACRRIFQGHWQPADEQIIEVSSEGGEDDSGDDDASVFYERPDWVQLVESHDLSPGSEKTVTGPRSPKHHSIRDLEVSAKNGCHLCTLIWDQLRSNLEVDLKKRSKNDFGGTYLDHAIGVIVVRPAFDRVHDDQDDENGSHSGPEAVDLEVLYFVDGDSTNRDAYFTTISLDLHPAKTYIQGPRIITSSTTKPTPAMLNHINDWTLNCNREHPSCNVRGVLREEEHYDSLPTRLLDVSSGELGPDYVRLRESRTLDRRTEYITLSHCWGPYLPVRLLENSLFQFLQQISISILPRTFQQAIDLVRALGKRYIWIDALCIVQDSPEDWLRESLRMASIYSQSYLNIAATSSADGHGGLFKERDQLLVSPCRINATWTGHVSSEYVCLDQTAWIRHVEGAHLNNRGWVLQERLLAPRNVHFANDQIWWECRKDRSCETFPQGVPEYGLNLDRRHVQLLAELYSESDTLQGYNYKWLGIVSIYTRTQLTKNSDRLIALAGVASAVQRILGWSREDYFAGLWRYDLAIDLLWRMATVGQRNKAIFIAPSWSWASVKGEVHFGSADNRIVLRQNSLIQIVDVKTDPGSFGPVLSGFIELHGTLYEVSLSTVIYWGGSDDDDMKGDETGNPRMANLHISDVVLSEDSFSESLDDEDLYKDDSVQQLHAHFCRFSTFQTPHIKEKYCTEGLLLEFVGADADSGAENDTGNGEMKIYRRIGWMRIFHDEYHLPGHHRENPHDDLRKCIFRII